MQSKGQTSGEGHRRYPCACAAAGNCSCYLPLYQRLQRGLQDLLCRVRRRADFDGGQQTASRRGTNAHRFDVKYTFDTGNSEPKDYNVKVIPNAERDFDFTVDGERYLYSKEDDLTAAFGLNKQDTYFELVIPEDFSLQYVLQSCYPGIDIRIPKEAESGNAYPYTLVISSYNESVVYRIDLSVGAEVTGVTLDPEQIIFTGTQE